MCEEAQDHGITWNVILTEFVRCTEACKKQGIEVGYNELWFREADRTLVHLCRQSKTGDDISISANVIRLRMLVEDGRIDRVFVVTQLRDNLSNIKVFSIEEIITLIEGYAPLSGQAGPYYWISFDAQLMRHNGIAGRLPESKEIPF